MRLLAIDDVCDRIMKCIGKEQLLIRLSVCGGRIFYYLKKELWE